ncbi:trace amine-associated receptor 13c-like [Nerophis ophidion]|uniref:trace amine-associated receptor 13c-like n=1 Tax=Nerophis ophidion TaxID=159077 RepID=UPI002ADFAC25|nr:trace amine-associated receptor 13c-like [Nerophis ophidion]
METEDQSELCFPQLGNISCKKPRSHWSGDILLTVLLSVICVFTVFLNLLVIISISHFRQLHTPTQLLLLSLAVSDFLVGLLVMPGEIYLRTSCWALGDVLCSLWNYVIFMVTFASVGHMVLISADRYAAICDPLHYNTRVTVGRVRFCVCLCWFFSFPYCGILLKEQLTHPAVYKSCHGECVIGFEYVSGVVDVVVSFVLPLGAIVILYMRVFTVAVSQARAMRSHVTSIKPRRSVTARAKKSELKAARTLGVVILVFILCYCPYYTFTLADDNKIISLLAHYVVYLFDFNSCLNPLIYTLFYPWFRKAVRCVVTLRILKSGSRGDNIL